MNSTLSDVRSYSIFFTLFCTSIRVCVSKTDVHSKQNLTNTGFSNTRYTLCFESKAFMRLKHQFYATFRLRISLSLKGLALKCTEIKYSGQKLLPLCQVSEFVSCSSGCSRVTANIPERERRLINVRLSLLM